MRSIATALYRIPLRSGLKGVDHRQQVEHCLQRGLVGIGWRLHQPPNSLDEALSISRTRWDNRVARTIARFASAPIGSLLWTRDLDGTFRLAELTGEWWYDGSPEAAAVDVNHVRNVTWMPEPLLDAEVPGAIVRQFVGPGSSFSRIHNETAARFSKYVFDGALGRPVMSEAISSETVLDREAFAHSAAGRYHGSDGGRVRRITTLQLLDFSREYPQLLPPRVRTWFEMAS